jgi:hypothetical protein
MGFGINYADGHAEIHVMGSLMKTWRSAANPQGANQLGTSNPDWQWLTNYSTLRN